MNPKISIITVSFNSSAHIEEAIRSVIEQTYDNFEYIIIDGGSTDRTVDIIKKYIDKIHYFVSEPDKGISDAFNKGILASTGDLIGIVNSDDKLYASDVLMKVAEYYSPELDIYRGMEIVRNYDTGYEHILHPTMKLMKNPLTFHVCHMAMFLSKTAIEKYGLYDVNFKYSMDMELLYRYLYRGARSVKMDVIVGLFRIGGVSQSYDKKKIKECALIVERIGGTQIQKGFYLFSLYTKDLIKKMLNRVNPDFARRLRYGKNIIGRK